MGLLDSVIGGLLGEEGGGASSPMGGILTALLGAGSQAGSLTNLGITGGIGGLLSRFEAAGLGQIAQSWVSNEPNQQVTPAQLQKVFSEDQVQGMASRAGLEPQEFLSQLGEHLPKVIDRMTPDGQVPDEPPTTV